MCTNSNNNKPKTIFISLNQMKHYLFTDLILFFKTEKNKKKFFFMFQV